MAPTVQFVDGAAEEQAVVGRSVHTDTYQPTETAGRKVASVVHPRAFAGNADVRECVVRAEAYYPHGEGTARTVEQVIDDVTYVMSGTIDKKLPVVAIEFLSVDGEAVVSDDS